MSGPTWRVLRTELLRGAAPPAAATTLVVGVLMMYTSANSWAGRWMPFAASVRFSMLVLAPLAIAFGAWQGGRERRRRVAEQLASTPRPSWQPLVVGWAGVTLGSWLGMLVVVAVGAAPVAAVATYSGGGWWWVLAVGFAGVAGVAAVGVALGRAVPFRLMAPVAAIVIYSLQVYAHDSGLLFGAEWLVPIMQVSEAAGNTLSGRVSLQQALWFGGLAAAVLVLVGARRRWLVVVPAAVATVGAAPLLGGPPYTSWQVDPTAAELVCTDDEPEVCLARVDAFLLDDVTPRAREMLARFDGVPGGPARAVGSTYGATGTREQALYVDTGRVTITGDLFVDEDSRVTSWWPELVCDSDAPHLRYHWMIEVAAIWASDGPQRWTAPEVRDPLDALLAMPEVDQKAWIGRVIEAAASCDEDVLTKLAKQLE